MTISLRSAATLLECEPDHGFVITRLVLEDGGNDLLWSRPDASVAPLPVSLDTPADSDDFDDRVFIGGWFGMFPTAGIPEAGDGRLMHGVLSRLRWDVVDHGETSVTAELRTPEWTVERMVAVDDGRARVETRARNDSGDAQEVSFGDHPCLSREVFGGGRISLQAADVWITPEASEPDAARLRPDQRTTWPFAQAPDGTEARLDAIPDRADASHDHVSVKLAAPTVHVSAPSLRGSLRIDVDARATPYLLLWSHYRPALSPRQGDTLGVEAMSTPGRTVADARAADAMRAVAPGDVVSWRMEMSWVADPAGEDGRDE